MRLGTLLADWRFANRIGVREAARRIGLSPATLSRIENGKNADGTSMTKIMLWLFTEEDQTETKRAKP
jgi:transcriptional regulator with XRE-family HTH domain